MITGGLFMRGIGCRECEAFCADRKIGYLNLNSSGQQNIGLHCSGKLSRLHAQSVRMRYMGKGPPALGLFGRHSRDSHVERQQRAVDLFRGP